MRKEVFIPNSVRKEAKVALIGPATRIKPEIVEAFVKLYEEHLEEMPGAELIVYPSALDAYASGSYAAPLPQRVADFTDA